MWPSKEEYAHFVYALEHTYPAIERLSLTFFTISSLEGRLKGEIVFRDQVILRLSETIDFVEGQSAFSHSRNPARHAVIIEEAATGPPRPLCPGREWCDWAAIGQRFTRLVEEVVARNGGLTGFAD